MKIKTRYFDEYEYTKNDIIKFNNGLFGFEDEKEFVLISFEENSSDLICMQSAKTDYLSFVLFNPYIFNLDYKPYVLDKDLKDLKAKTAEDLYFYVISVIKESIPESTANLKAPIFINPKEHLAKQVILEDSEYSFSVKLGDFRKEVE